ncbi:hypothetical protein [uncultured Helicobacter sp.]|uniref:hypothetical protein n=1 Tax=uncultured Helicobacter sp. TaxID=175537 RepID=UPI00375295DC
MNITTQNGLHAYENLKGDAPLENLKHRAKSSSIQKLQHEEDKKLREQTDNFEALFLQIMLKDAIKNENPLYPKQPGSDIYHSMYIENLAQNLSGSFGYSELLFNYLKDLQK